MRKLKRQGTHWEKIFARHISDKGSISRVYRKHSQLSDKKTSSLLERKAKHLDGHFTEEETRMASKPMKRYSLLVVREMQIKSTVRCQYASVRVA